MTFTKDQMRAVAEKVYPLPSGREWRIYEGKVCNFDKEHLTVYAEEFSPSLTGTDMQKANALQCILAAFNLGHTVKLGKYKDEFWLDWLKQSTVDPMLSNSKCAEACPDILTASLAALLASTPSAVENEG